MSEKSLFFKQILRLEKDILSSLKADNFCSVTAQCLKGVDFSTFEGMKTLRECLPLSKSVLQYYSPTAFGKSNLTLVNNNRFIILLMYMDDISTEIHDHSFEGVFTPLMGSPVQLTFSFQSEKKRGESIEEGKLLSTGYKVLATHEPVAIEKGFIHMLERPRGGQFSLLILRPLSQDERMSAFYLYPALKLINREGHSYLSRVISTFQMNHKLSDEEIESLLKPLTEHELIQLFFRIGPELSDRVMSPEEILFIREYTKKELVRIQLWPFIESHMKFLQMTKAKTSVLIA